MSTKPTKKASAKEIVVTAMLDIILTGADGTTYVCGPNQVLPVWDTENGYVSKLDIALYTAMRWKDYYYTSCKTCVTAANAYSEVRSHPSTLGYGYGLRRLRITDSPVGLFCEYGIDRYEQGVDDIPMSVCKFQDMLTCANQSVEPSTRLAPFLYYETDKPTDGHKVFDMMLPGEGIKRMAIAPLPVVLTPVRELLSTWGYKEEELEEIVTDYRWAIRGWCGDHNVKRLYIGLAPDKGREPSAELEKWESYNLTFQRYARSFYRTKDKWLRIDPDRQLLKRALVTHNFDYADLW